MDYRQETESNEMERLTERVDLIERELGKTQHRVRELENVAKAFAVAFVLMGIGLALSGCATAPAPTVDLGQLTDAQLATVAAVSGGMDKSAVEFPPILSAVSTLAYYDIIIEYGWTEPTTGSPAVRYRTNVASIVSRPSIYVLSVQRDSLRVQAAGIDEQGRQGPWSNWSEFYPNKETTK